MPATAADVMIDDVVFALCMTCDAPFSIRDGWDGACPECCAIHDDHDAGRHDFRPVAECRGCDVAEDRLDLPAIA